MRNLLLALAMVLGFTTSVFAQAADTAFQVRHAINLKKKDTVVFSNSGATSTVPSPQNGRLCMNLYAFSTSGPMIDCCTCPVGANNLVVVGIVKDLLDDPKPAPKSLVLKAMASTGGTNAAACNAATVGTGQNNLATGMLAWKGDLPFTPATLSAAELTTINAQCGVLHALPKICASCQTSM